MGEKGPESGDELTPATPHCWLRGGGGGRGGGEEGTEEVHDAVGGGGEVVQVQQRVPEDMHQLCHLGRRIGEGG